MIVIELFKLLIHYLSKQNSYFITFISTEFLLERKKKKVCKIIFYYFILLYIYMYTLCTMTKIEKQNSKSLIFLALVIYSCA